MIMKKTLSRAMFSAATVAFMLPMAMMVNAAPQQRYIVKYKVNQETTVKNEVKSAGGRVKLDLRRHDAVAITLPAGKLASFLKNDKIEYIEIDELRTPVPTVRESASGADRKINAGSGDAPAQVVPYGVSLVQAEGMQGNVNSGIKICVIDSGYDIQHEDKPKYPVVDGTDDMEGTGPWTEDGSGHGTHVSGTINALDNGIGVIGVFPNAPLHVVRVFGNDGLWAYSSELVNALDDCIAHGAKIVSMSLGADRPTRLENMAFRKAELSGVLSIAAAGNDADYSKPGFDAFNYPAAYQSVMSVAAVDHNSAIANFSQRNTDVEIAAPGVSVLSTVPTGSMYGATLSVSGQADIAAIAMDNFDIPTAPIGGPLANCGLGTTPADCGGAAAGFTCLIERGEVSFATKVVSCQTAGGVSAVVFQREGVDGPVYGTLGATLVNIPAVGIDRASGLNLRANAIGSSASLSIFQTGYDYSYYNGTSMATPHVAAVAALVWSTHPNCSNTEIRNALNATAKDLGARGQDHVFGNGLVQAQAAGEYLDEHACSGH